MHISSQALFFSESSITVPLIQPNRRVCGSDVHHWLNATFQQCLQYSIWEHICPTPTALYLFFLFKCVAQLQLFPLFLSVLSFGLFYGSFYNEVVLCDDQKLWCSSIVFKYLMSLKYGLKSVWTSDPAAPAVSFVSLEHTGPTFLKWVTTSTNTGLSFSCGSMESFPIQ